LTNAKPERRWHPGHRSLLATGGSVLGGIVLTLGDSVANIDPAARSFSAAPADSRYGRTAPPWRPPCVGERQCVQRTGRGKI